MARGRTATLRAVEAAAVRSRAITRESLLERAFAQAFRGLVYAQIWEDPVVDMAALAIAPGMRLITIASGGCNALSYLTADPAEIVAIDLNTAHVALNKLKLAAAQHLPDYAHFRRFFAAADCAENIDAYRQYVRPHLDDVTRRYWERRDLIGRRRIAGFGDNIYKRGLLGRFIGAAHRLARLYGVDPRELLAAKSADEQRRIFEVRIAPLLEKRLVRWLTAQPASLFGLGIPPAQYVALAGDHPEGITAVLRQRLEKLACAFPLSSNYFAWQAFGRGYDQSADAPLPPYLEPANHAQVTARAGRIKVVHANMIAHLAAQPGGTFDRFVLLDAQDWMTDAQLTALWQEITRTARVGARVLFRTAAELSLLPGRVPAEWLDRWHYDAATSQACTARDRSAIYGGVHLYVLKG